MAEGRPLRRIGDAVVAGAPAGVRIRTRIELTTHGGVVVAVGGGDHPRRGGSIPVAHAGLGGPGQRICVPR